jgi:hypothetical protein
MRLEAASRGRSPAPKAICPGCGRPIAMLKAGQCLYCGKRVGGAVVPVSDGERMRAMAEAMLLPRRVSGGQGRKWAIRLGAVAISAFVVLGVLGSCMKG